MDCSLILPILTAFSRHKLPDCDVFSVDTQARRLRLPETACQGQITKVVNPTERVVAADEYDALGRRIEFIDEINSVTKRYLHDGPRVLEEYDGAATPVRQRYYIWGNYIDELLVIHDDGGGGTDYFVCHNHLYSPEALLNNTGGIVERYDYDAYGKPYIYTATAAGGGDGDWWDGDETTASVSAKGLPYLFTGREYEALDDGDLKLYYYRARHYHPNLGRFLQRDPAGHIDGMNLYEYVRNNPLGHLDPHGYFIAIPGYAAYVLGISILVAVATYTGLDVALDLIFKQGVFRPPGHYYEGKPWLGQNSYLNFGKNFLKVGERSMKFGGGPRLLVTLTAMLGYHASNVGRVAHNKLAAIACAFAEVASNFRDFFNNVDDPWESSSDSTDSTIGPANP